MVDDAPTADRPPRRRSSWSLRSIVEDVSGKPIDDFQEPGRPVHPYLQAKGGGTTAVAARSGAAAAPAAPAAGADGYDPVAHLYPPLVGAPGRAYHGPEHEQHSETLARHPPAAAGVGERPRLASPLHRPERLYLHYLLLHLDRLSDAALVYLHTAVDEELRHRARPPPATPPAPTAAAPGAVPPAPAAAPPPIPLPAA